MSETDYPSVRFSIKRLPHRVLMAISARANGPTVELLDPFIARGRGGAGAQRDASTDGGPESE